MRANYIVDRRLLIVILRAVVYLSSTALGQLAARLREGVGAPRYTGRQWRHLRTVSGPGAVGLARLAVTVRGVLCFEIRLAVREHVTRGEGQLFFNLEDKL